MRSSQSQHLCKMGRKHTLYGTVVRVDASVDFRCDFERTCADYFLGSMGTRILERAIMYGFFLRKVLCTVVGRCFCRYPVVISRELVPT